MKCIHFALLPEKYCILAPNAQVRWMIRLGGEWCKEQRGRVNEAVEIVGIRPTKNTVVTGVEMFKKLLDEGMAGDNVGLLLRGVDRKDIERGQVISKPGSITQHTKFKAEAYVLTKEEGGRHTPFFTGYRPQFYFRTTDVTGVAHLPE